eukprot:14882702-Alexandrium_andersonii.AAC.1
MSASLVGSEMCIRDRPGLDSLTAEPYIVQSVAKLMAFYDEDADLQSYVSRMLAQAPLQQSTNAQGRALALVKSSSAFATPLRALMRPLAPGDEEAIMLEAK